MTKLLLSSLLTVSVACATEISNETNTTTATNSPTNTELTGWYAGASIGLTNFGGEVVFDNGDNTETSNVDTTDKPIVLNVGYVTDNDNRIELYYKNDSFEEDSKEGSDKIYETSTFGINYQWGLSSLSSEKFLPYIGVGLGYGSADLPKEAKPLDADTAVEFALCVGMYYTVTPNIDVSAELYRRAVVVDFTNSGLSDATVATAVNGLEFGVNYHF